MLSKAIIQDFKTDSALVALVGTAAQMFAEFGKGNQCLVVKQTTKGRIIIEIAPLKTSAIQVLVKGYAIDSGEAIAKKALSLLEAYEGQTLTTTTEQYKILSVSIISEPTLISWDDKPFTLNVQINYLETQI